MLTALLVGAGCASPGTPGSRTDTPIAPGSVLVLEEGMLLPTDDARVHFQAGRVTRYHDRNRFAPWCSLGLREDGDEPLQQAIKPGRFRVEAARSGARAGTSPLRGLRVAGTVPTLAGMHPGGGGLGHLTWYLELRLHSEEQPQVDDLTCAIDRPPDWRGRLGLESVRQALSGLGRIVPAGD
ncbi:hypothetical protein [Halofilum ochraceum]|uniref:hypothetical protein n=1 Tax=Halofilum ochraceum TaxID=1611323 RepID=UPI0011131637|nr:hypothetical protein [Halofilum ochraceum]